MLLTRKIITLVGLAVTLCSNFIPEKAAAATTTAAPSAIIIIPDDNSCYFNGQVVQDGESITAYQNSTVAYGTQCISEKRTCSAAKLSGSYQYASCVADQPASCLFNGQTVANGQAIVAYQNSTVAYGSQCAAETRICNNGVLSGSANYAACSVDQPASCLFNGQTVANGQSVSAFVTSTVGYGESCQSEQRTCNNGVLSGSANYAACSVDQPASCLFNGQTVAHGQLVKAFQNSSVAYGSSCLSQDRLCNNGVLSGAYQYGACSVDQPASCLFNGQTIANGQSVNAFATSTVAYGSSCQSEQRTCNNGVLSGSASYASCSVDQPASCLFNGQTIANGQSVNAFATSTVAYGSSCQAEQRTCNNGVLSGSASYASCSVNQPASCLFNGQTIANGQVVTGFAASSVAYGSTCQSEQRTCNNGVLSGSASYASCSVNQPVSCSFNGQPVAHGQSVLAYLSSSVPAGSSCKSEQRLCDNGALSGSYAQSSCTVQNPTPNPTPKSCSINGVVVASGKSIKLFKSASVPYGSSCAAEERLCTDGVLSGSAIYQSCSVEPKPPVPVPPKDECDKNVDRDHKEHHDHGKHLGEIKHGHVRKNHKDKKDDDCDKDKHHHKKPCEHKDKDKHDKDCDHDKNKNEVKKPCDKDKKDEGKKPCDKNDKSQKDKKPCDDDKKKTTVPAPSSGSVLKKK